MSDIRYQTILPEEDGQRLDNYLIRILKGVPKSHIYRIIRAGEVRVNKKRAKPDTRLHVDDLVRIPPLRMAIKAPVFVGDALAEKLQKQIIHEDPEFLVINKPAGMAVHGGSGLSLGIIEAFRKMRPDLAYLELAHRLDKETSGCLIMVKKRSVLRDLQALFTQRKVTKVYWALLEGAWKGRKNQMIDVPLEKNILQSGERMVNASKSGKASETYFHLLENFKIASLVEAIPKTGRTHQIRVHCAYLGSPILGDNKYGKQRLNKVLQKRLYLHARAVQFTLKGIQYRFKADLDHAFEHSLQQLRTGSMQHNA